MRLEPGWFGAAAGRYTRMQIRRHATAEEFLHRAERWLLRAEAENNLILGLAYRARQTPPAADAEPYWVTVERRGTVVGSAFRTAPHSLGITRLPVAGLAPLAEDARYAFGCLPGVSGPVESASRFAEAWCATTGQSWHVEFRLRVHALDAVRVPPRAPGGTLRSARSADLPVATRWLADFIREAQARHVSPELAEQLMRLGQLYFWDDAGPRSMAAVGRETRNGAVISAVYTPPEQRARGYASAAVAALSHNLLGGGKRFCCLYADVANAAANSIYRAVGYAPVADALDIVFSSAEGTDARRRASRAAQPQRRHERADG